MRSSLAAILGAFAASCPAALAADPIGLRPADPDRRAQRVTNLVSTDFDAPRAITLDAGIVSHDFVGEHRLDWFITYLEGIDSPNTREALSVILEVVSAAAPAPDAASPAAPDAVVLVSADGEVTLRPRGFSWSDNARAVPSPGSGVLALAALALIAQRRRD